MPRDPRLSFFFGSHQTSPIKCTMIRQARISDTALVTSREMTEAESKVKHGVWDPMPESTFIPQSETLDLASGRTQTLPWWLGGEKG